LFNYKKVIVVIPQSQIKNILMQRTIPKLMCDFRIMDFKKNQTSTYQGKWQLEFLEQKI